MFNGLGNWLRKRVDATGAQLNLFDHGATYNSVMNRPPAPQAPQIPQRSISPPPAPPKPAGFFQRYNPGNIAGGIQQGVNRTFQDIHSGINKVGSFGNQMAEPVASTIDLPLRSIALTAAKLTHNPVAAQNAQNTLNTDVKDNIFNSATKPLSNTISGAIYEPFATRAYHQSAVNLGNKVSQAYGNTKMARNFGNIVQNASENQMLNNYLNSSGFSQNDSLGADVRKLAGQTAEAASPLLYGLGPAEGVGTKALLKTATKFGVGNALIGAASTATQDNPQLPDYLKSAGKNFVVGATLPLLGKAPKSMFDQIRNLPDTLRTNTMNLAANGKATQTMPLNKLFSYEGAPDRARVNQYKQAIQNGQKVNPLIVLKEGNKYSVGDGQHRLQALKELGIKSAPVKIVNPNEVRTAAQGGFAKIPGSGAVGKNVKPNIPEIPPEKTPEEDMMQSLASEYNSPEEYINSAAKSAYEYDKSLKGGQMRKMDELGGAGQFIRTTEHTPFYSQFYAKNNRAPSLRDFQDQIRNELETGNHELTEPGERDIYQLLKEREAGTQALSQEAPYYKKIDVTKKYQSQKPIKIISIPESEILNGKDLGGGKKGSAIDAIMANSTGVSEARAAHDRLVSQAKIDADRQALETLRTGGTRDDAIRIYRSATGTSEKQAKFRISQIAKQADQSLNVLKPGKNPLLEQFKFRTPKIGEYAKVSSNRRAVVNSIANVERRALSYEGQLSANDKANLIDYIQGVKDINMAENPQMVSKAVAEWRRAADTIHAIGENYGKTKYGEQFFPGYWDRNDPRVMEMQRLEDLQDLEEQYGTQEWNNMTPAEKEQALAEHQANPMYMGEDANYAGFHTKSKIFKNQAEGVAAGFKPMFENPFDAMRRYFNGAKLQLGNQAVIQGLRDAEPNPAGQRYAINLPGGAPATVGKKGIKILSQEGVRPPASLPVKALRGGTRSIIKTIVANPLIHGGNQEFNALFSAAWEMPGFRPNNMLKIIKSQIDLADNPAVYDKWRTEFYKEGGFSPTYGKDQYGFIARGLGKTGIDPKWAELSPRGMAALEENIRVGLFKTARERGMNPEDAIKSIDRALGDPRLLNDMSSMLGLFLHYFTTNVKILGRSVTSAGKGNFYPIIGLTVGYAAWAAANKEWQNVTGNPDASVRAPGALGTAQQIAKAPGQVKRGQIPSFITSHTNPIVTEVISGATNRDLRKPVFGPSSASNTIRGPQGEGVRELTTKTLFGPGETILRTSNGKQSLPESVMGNLTGLYTPHAKGYQAAPKIPILNAPGAQAGTGIAARDNYFKAQDSAYKVLGNNQKNLDMFNAYRDSERDPNDPSVIIGRSPRETRQRWATLYANDTVRSAIQTMERQLPNHDPIWDLSPDKLKVAVDYQMQYSGDPERTRLEQKYNWLQGFVQNRANWQSQQTYTGGYRPNPESPAYPNIDPQTKVDMNAYTKLTDPNEIGDFLSTHPNVLNAFKQLGDYTNKMRVAEGALPLAQPPQPSAHVESILNGMPTGNDTASKRARAMMINGNPDVAQYLADNALFHTTKNLAGYYLQINDQSLGQQLNSGDRTAQQTLKSIYALGNYDIGHNSTTGQYGFMQNGGFPVGSGLKTPSGSMSRRTRRVRYFPRQKSVRIKSYHIRKPRKVYLQKPKTYKQIKRGVHQSHVRNASNMV